MNVPDLYEADGWGLRFRIESFDPENETVEMTVWEHESVRKDFVVMQAVIFPQINWLWLGCVLMTLVRSSPFACASDNAKPLAVANYRMVLIGAGRVSCELGPAWQRDGHEVLHVVSRTERSARHLGEQLGCPWTTSLSPQVHWLTPKSWSWPSLTA